MQLAAWRAGHKTECKHLKACASAQTKSTGQSTNQPTEAQAVGGGGSAAEAAYNPSDFQRPYPASDGLKKGKQGKKGKPNGTQVAASSTSYLPTKKDFTDGDCAICLDVLTPPPVRLPCGHHYCAGCVQSLRAHGVSQACPTCRAPLPREADELNDEASRKFVVVCST